MQLVRCDKCGKEGSKGSVVMIARSNHDDPLSQNIFMGDMCSSCFAWFKKEMTAKREHNTDANDCWCNPKVEKVKRKKKK